jgi:hypothetical protein
MKTAATGYLEITEAKYVSDHKIRLIFNDGAVRVVDFGPFLAKARNPDTTDYRDLRRFKSFRIEDGDLIWGDMQMIFPIMDLYSGEISMKTKLENGMSATTEQVFTAALSLPARARAALVQKLLLSLEPEDSSPEIEAAWKEEAASRCKAFDEGKLTERNAADVLQDAYRKLK